MSKAMGDPSAVSAPSTAYIPPSRAKVEAKYDALNKLISQLGKFYYFRVLTHSLTHLLTRSLTHSLTHSLTYLLTKLLTYSLAYEHIKTTLLAYIKTHSLSVPIAGGISGAFGWFVSFPLDAIKGNIQGRQLDSGTRQRTSYEVAMQLLQQKGVQGLYSGLLPSITRAFLVSSTRFSAYETTLWLLQHEK